MPYFTCSTENPRLGLFQAVEGILVRISSPPVHAVPCVISNPKFPDNSSG